MPFAEHKRLLKELVCIEQSPRARSSSKHFCAALHKLQVPQVGSVGAWLMEVHLVREGLPHWWREEQGRFKLNLNLQEGQALCDVLFPPGRLDWQ